MRTCAWIAGLAVAALANSALAQSEDTKLSIELNKLETFEGGCRSFFLFRNRTDLTLSSFEMSLAILDRHGVIDRLLTIDAAPLPAVRTVLKIFEIPEITCDNVGEMILHDIAACATASNTEIDCFDVIELSSRAAAALVK